MTVQELLRRLPELSKSDLEKVKHRVQLLSGGSANFAQSRENQEDWLLVGFGRELRRRGLLAGKVWNNLVPKSWNEKSSSVREFLIKGASHRLTTPERISLAQVSADSLAEYLTRASITVSPKTLFSNVDKVPVALDCSFPGYWGAKKLDFCFGGTAACQNS